MPVTASVGPLLRVPRTDVEGDRFILLQAKPAASSALSSTPTELDVYLQATEGEAAYGVQIKHSRVHKFISRKTFTGTQEEFATILTALLFPNQVDDKDRHLIEGIALSAGIEDGTITLAVRKSVGAIKQRIAAIDIPSTEDEIGLYEWAGETCSARDAVQEKLKAAEHRLEQQQTEIEKLMVQMNDLAKLKQEHEATLLVKFQALLNNKKQHIRDLIQLLEKGREVTPPPAETVEEEEQSEPVTKKGKGKAKVTRGKGKAKAAPTRGKRKTSVKELSADEESDSDAGFATMAIDNDGESEKLDEDEAQDSDTRTTEDEVEVEPSGDEEPGENPTKLKKADYVPEVKAPARRGWRAKESTPNPTFTRASKRVLRNSPTPTTTMIRGRRKTTAAKTPEPAEPSLSPPPAPPATTSNFEDELDEDTDDDDEL